MKRIVLILTCILCVACQNGHLTIEDLDDYEKKIINVSELEINESRDWNVRIDSIRFYVYEYANDGNVFVGEAFGKSYDMQDDIRTNEYYDEAFVSAFYIYEGKNGNFDWNPSDIILNMKGTEINRFRL